MLPWDQVPPGRRAIGGLATPLDDELGLLNVNLAVWMARDDTRAGASVVRAGNQVMDSIDAMLRQLHQLRARMAAERREDQDAAAARADKLLAATDALLGDLNAPADPLVRRLRFEAAHPGITITAPETHASMWTARQDGKILATDYQLGGLMDALDWLLP